MNDITVVEERGQATTGRVDQFLMWFARRAEGCARAAGLICVGLGVWHRRMRVEKIRRDRVKVDMKVAPTPVNELVLQYISALGMVLATAVGAIVGLGVLCALSGVCSLGTYFSLLADVIHWLIIFLVASVAVAPILILLGAYGTGRTVMMDQAMGYGEDPIHELVPAAALGPSAPSLELVAGSLREMDIPAIKRAVKEGQPACRAVIQPHREGDGVSMEFELPTGASVSDVVSRKEKLAAGLRRSVREVWIEAGRDASRVSLWVADEGALSTPIGDWPGASGDVFTPIPLGQSLRGKAFSVSLVGRHTLIGGQPDQGKSNAARVLLAGAALDPTVEIVAMVPAENNDFESYRGRGAVIAGADDESILQMMQTLESLLAEVDARGRLLREHGKNEVDRELASAGVGLHPLVVLLEEAHMLFTHPEYGEVAGKMWTRLILLSRKVGIWSITSTQSPTKANLPRDVTRNTTIGIAFAVTDHVANDGILGEGAYSSGVRATSLVPGEDRGTCIVRGVAPTPTVVRTWRLTAAPDFPAPPHRTGFAAAKPAASQPVAQPTPQEEDEGPAYREDITNPVVLSLVEDDDGEFSVPPAESPQPAPASPGGEQRDVLSDVLQVFSEDEDELTAAEVTRRLLKAHPFHSEYRKLTGQRLRSMLDKRYGVVVPSTGNRFPVRKDQLIERQNVAV